MNLTFIKNELIKHENLALIVAEIANPTIIGDVLEHETLHLKRVFVKNFKNNDENFLTELKNFCKESVDAIKNDAKGIKKLICYHKKHPELIKKFVEESLVEDGLENLATAAIVSTVSLEGLPAAVGVYALSKAFRAIIINEFKDKLSVLREKTLGSEEIKADKKI